MKHMLTHPCLSQSACMVQMSLCLSPRMCTHDCACLMHAYMHVVVVVGGGGMCMCVSVCRIYWAHAHVNCCFSSYIAPSEIKL